MEARDNIKTQVGENVVLGTQPRPKYCLREASSESEQIWQQERRKEREKVQDSTDLRVFGVTCIHHFQRHLILVLVP